MQQGVQIATRRTCYKKPTALNPMEILGPRPSFPQTRFPDSLGGLLFVGWLLAPSYKGTCGLCARGFPFSPRQRLPGLSAAGPALTRHLGGDHAQSRLPELTAAQAASGRALSKTSRSRVEDTCPPRSPLLSFHHLQYSLLEPHGCHNTQIVLIKEREWPFFPGNAQKRSDAGSSLLLAVHDKPLPLTRLGELERASGPTGLPG